MSNQLCHQRYLKMAYRVELPPDIEKSAEIPGGLFLPRNSGNSGNGGRDNQRIDATEGSIIAVLIDSPIVGPVWFAFADDWESGEDIPVFYASEIAHLQKMSPEELRKRYEQKLALGGGWIRERIEERTKH
jgi:hypothetical protein